MISTLYNDAQTVLSWWRQRPKAFDQWLAESHRTDVKDLKEAVEVHYVHRAQGRVAIWDRLLGLDKELQTKERT